MNDIEAKYYADNEGIDGPKAHQAWEVQTEDPSHAWGKRENTCFIVGASVFVAHLHHLFISTEIPKFAVVRSRMGFSLQRVKSWAPTRRWSCLPSGRKLELPFLVPHAFNSPTASRLGSAPWIALFFGCRRQQLGHLWIFHRYETASLRPPHFTTVQDVGVTSRDRKTKRKRA